MNVNFIKKNYIDATSGFLYALGCSLVHFSMVVASLFVEYPHIDKAAEIDFEINSNLPSAQLLMGVKSECEAHANTFHNLMVQLVSVHILCGFITFYREIYESNIELIGLVMRSFEIIGTMMYIGSIVMALNAYNMSYGYDLDAVSVNFPQFRGLIEKKLFY